MSDLARAAPRCRFTRACVFNVNGDEYCPYHRQLVDFGIDQARSEVERPAPAHLPPPSSPAPARRDG